MRGLGGWVLGVLGLMTVVAGGCTRNQYVKIDDWDATVRISGLPRGFSSDDPRLKRAAGDLAQVLGHEVRLHFEIDQMPQSAGWMEWFLSTQIGRIPLDFAGFKAGDPERFAKSAESLRRIDFDYDGAARETTVELSRGGRRATVVLDGGELPRGLLTNAYAGEHREKWAKRLDDVNPRSLPAGKHEDYFRFLEGEAQEKAAERAPQDEPDRGRPEVIMKRIALHDVVNDAELRTEIRERLARDGMYFVESARDEPQWIAAAKPDSKYRKAEAKWVEWFRKHERSLEPEHRAEALRALYASGEGGMLHPVAFRTFDPVAHGLAALREYEAAGFPRDDSTAQREAPGAAHVVCVAPYFNTETNIEGYASQKPTCKAWLGEMLGEPRNRAALVKALLGAKKLDTVRHVFVHASEVGTPEQVVSLWNAMKKDPKRWRAAAGVLGGPMCCDRELGEQLFFAAAEQYKTGRERGAALFVLADNAYFVNWFDFGKVYGGLASRKDFEAFMSMGPQALQSAAQVYPALQKGVGAARVVERPLLKAYESGVEFGSRRTAEYVMLDLAEEWASWGAVKEVQHIRTVMNRLAKRSPEDSLRIGSYRLKKIEEYVRRAEGCQDHVGGFCKQR